MAQPDLPHEKASGAERRPRWRVSRGFRAAGRGLAPLGGAGRFAVDRLVFWAPVWLPLVVVLQLALGGLRPARAEERRLDHEEAGVARRVDALLGTGFRGELRGKALSLLALLDPIRRGLAVAVDLPSGLDCDSGRACEHTFRADLTATFVAPKVGFASPGAGPYLGRVETVSIGTPPELVRRVRSARGGGSGNTSVRLL